ncbi:MAG: SRPBCC domain-containing protein [Hyphomonadaceae bacterium]|nr:SRPBCC domain-containing protein [Hyphomonadaceae bacterium]
MSAVIVSLRVNATPQEAFDAFTQEIGLWWRPNGLFQITPRGDGVLRFESGEGGRLLTDLSNGKSFEIGRITTWRPGERLSFTWRQGTFAPEQATQVEVRFEAVGDETRVTVEHRGWDAIPEEHAARHGFPLAAFQMRLGEHWRGLLASLRAQIDERCD